MTDTPQNTPGAGPTGPSLTGPTQPRDLSGVSEMFGLQEERAVGGNSGALTGTITVGQKVVVKADGIAQPAEVSGRLVHGRYRLIAELGAGGMGVTYRAWDTAAGIPVVVKMPRREVRQDTAATQRFAREIDSMLASQHESIVPITDHGKDDGCPFVVMRFLPGGTFSSMGSSSPISVILELPRSSMNRADSRRSRRSQPRRWWSGRRNTWPRNCSGHGRSPMAGWINMRLR